MNDDEAVTEALDSQGFVVPTEVVVKRSNRKHGQFDVLHSLGKVIVMLGCMIPIDGSENYRRNALIVLLVGLGLILVVRRTVKRYGLILKMLGTSDAACRIVDNQLLIGDGEEPTIFPLSKRDVAAYTIAALPSARIVHGS